MILFRNLSYMFRCPRLKYTILLTIILILAVFKFNQEDELTPMPDPFGRFGLFYSQTDNRYYEEPDSSGKISYEDPNFLLRAALRKGPGEMGQPVHVDTDEKDAAEKSMYWHGYNSYVSEKIPLWRSLNDYRHPTCKEYKYLKDLPKVSIIIPFFEEHHHTLKRTIISVLNTAPSRLVEEMILVDDGSTENKEDLEPLQQWIDSLFPTGLIKIIRNKQREGLIRARQYGAEAAKAKIFVFLDCHVEPLHNWLPPLIEPIAMNYKTVTCPFIDVVDMKTFEYRKQDDGARGMFDWRLDYKRRTVTKADQENMPKPFDSPVMAGGLFAISADWFWELGGYDLGMYIWGGEQYEISFKIWMCHGRMVDVPCSRIGHIYRRGMPYKNPKPGAITINFKRLTETLMDEYAEYVYMRHPEVLKADPGDITDRKSILKKLECKSFDWFMKEVAFDLTLYYPVVDPMPYISGQIKLARNQKKCIKMVNEKMSLGTCDNTIFQHTFINEIRTVDMCIDAYVTSPDEPGIFYFCHGGRGHQEFIVIPVPLENGSVGHLLKNPGQMCITADQERDTVHIIACTKNNQDQIWIWEGVKSKEAFASWNKYNITYDVNLFFL